ncbi:MAG: Asp23/Gls24 family envelope stress response protein [Ruminococcus sp.]|nr:Asp23/Gls24 family envelope stress response protein [Ruminococcus sp.]
MIKVNNHIGTIGVSTRYLRTLVSLTAQSCFGVSGMNSYGAVQSVNSFFKRRSENSGVIIRQSGNKLTIDLHITVTYGVNVGAISESIAHKVSYVLTERAGIELESVNVFVDALVD